MGAAGNIDEYIQGFGEPVRSILSEMRAAIKEAIPEASEKISYGMPTFFFQGNLVHFAACKTHIGYYPSPSGIEPFIKELSGYHLSKGAIQFPLDEPLPLGLIARIAKHRLAENLVKARKTARK